ncbi:MAG TPA: hypothetical protein VFK30_05515, partial [Anaerolineae bacterium]|nr:hypothetical protein [Anaerolineae bacterium]
LNLGAASTSTGTGDVVGNINRTHAFTPDASYAYGNPFVAIAFNTGTTTNPTAVNVELVKHTPGSFALATSRAYTITLTGGTGLNATLTLHYAAADLNGNTAANLKLLRWNGSLWQLMGRTGAVDTINGAVTLAGVTAFSPWAISAQNPTAVTLQDFSAQSNSSPLLPGLLALVVLALGAVAIMTRARRHA